MNNRCYNCVEPATVIGSMVVSWDKQVREYCDKCALDQIGLGYFKPMEFL